MTSSVCIGMWQGVVFQSADWQHPGIHWQQLQVVVYSVTSAHSFLGCESHAHTHTNTHGLSLIDTHALNRAPVSYAQGPQKQLFVCSSASSCRPEFTAGSSAEWQQPLRPNAVSSARIIGCDGLAQKQASSGFLHTSG